MEEYIIKREMENMEKEKKTGDGQLKLLSLFSGCGGMDIGFEGGFVCHRKSVGETEWIEEEGNGEWVRVKRTRFRTVFANDILEEAKKCWLSYMGGRGHSEEVFRFGSIVDYVKRYKDGYGELPDGVDIVIGGFPCQDFSVAGKRRGFDSQKDHNGNYRDIDAPSEETRGKLYCWMKQVIEITRPRVFVAENVKGLVSLGDVKDIIQHDFAEAGGDGYIVLSPRVLCAADYGVPESRERVIFIGIRKEGLTDRAKEELGKETVSEEYDPYPRKTHSAEGDGLMPYVVCRDVLGGLAEPDETEDLSHRHYSKAKFMGAHCQGQREIDMDKIGPTIRSEHHGNIEYRRLSKEHGGKCLEELAKGMRERRLTPRECALIQTFPPDYEFVRRRDGGRFEVSASGAYKVIGNAVPPVMAYNIARRIEEVWGLYFGDGE